MQHSGHIVAIARPPWILDASETATGASAMSRDSSWEPNGR